MIDYEIIEDPIIYNYLKEKNVNGFERLVVAEKVKEIPKEQLDAKTPTQEALLGEKSEEKKEEKIEEAPAVPQE